MFLGLQGLRLTPRGKRVAWSAAVLLLLTGLGAALPAAAWGPPQPPVVVEHMVAPGDTLWAIATQYKAPGEDTRDAVRRIQRANQLATAQIAVGQLVVVELIASPGR